MVLFSLPPVSVNDNNDSYAKMMQYLSTLLFGFHAYPITITTPEEYNFIQTTFGSVIGGLPANSRVYVGGTKLDVNSDEWIYSNGTAEYGMPFYQQSVGRCYTVCPWLPGQPSVAPNQQYLSLKNYQQGSSKLYLQTTDWVTSLTTNLQYVLVELRGTKDPVMTIPPPTSGGVIYLKNFVMDDGNFNWNMSTLKITIIPSDGTNAYYPTITLDSPTSVHFTINPGVDAYGMIIGDDKKTVPTMTYRYQLPYISTLYANTLTTGSLITLTGTNFGTNYTLSKISVKYGSTQTVCSNPIIVVNQTVLTCKLTTTVSSTAPLYPISLSIGTNSFVYTSNRIPFYDPNTVKVIKIGDSAGNYTTVRNVILGTNNSVAIESNPITQGVITSAPQSSFINSIYNWGSNQVHQALESSSNGIVATSGQLSGTVVMPNFVCSATLVFCGSNSPVTSATKTVGYIPSRLVDTTSTNACELSMFGQTPTSQNLGVISSSVPTTGTTLTLPLSYSGFLFTKRTYKLSNYPNSVFTDIILNTNTQQVQVKIPAGVGKDIVFTLYLEDVVALTGTFSYVPPVLSTVSSGSIFGDVVTVVGSNFGVDSSLLSGQFVGESTAFSNFQLADQTKFTCTIPSGVGASGQISITVGNQIATNNLPYKYLSPIISNIAQFGTVFQLTGTNLGLPSQLPTLTQSGTVLNATGNAQQNTLFISLPSHTKRGPIALNLAGQQTTFSFDPLPVVSQITPTPSASSTTTITISGAYLDLTNQQGDALPVSITIGGQTCSNPSNNGVDLFCNAPANVGIQTISISINNRVSQAEITYEAPVLQSILQNDDKLQVVATNVGSVASAINITISGVSFAASSIANGVVYFNSMPNGLFSSLVTISVFRLQSNSIPFSISPVVKSVSSAPTVGGQVTVSGQFFNDRDFSSNPQVLSVNINGACDSPQIVANSANTKLTCKVGAGTGTGYKVTVVSGTTSSTSSVIYSYQAPNITSIVHQNSVVTIMANNLGLDASVITTQIGGQTLTATGFVSGNTGVTFTIPAQSQNCDIKLSVNSVSSSPFPLRLTPAITSVTSAPTIGGRTTIYGQFLSIDRCDNSQSTIVIKIDQTTCSNPSSNGTAITCTAVPGTGNNHQLVVTIDGVNSQPTAFEYLPPSIAQFTQQSANCLVDGQNLGDDPSKVTVYFGDLPINIKSFSNPSQFVTQIPPLALNGDLSVVIDNQRSNSIPYKLLPILLSVTSPENNGGQITITGLFLNDKRQDGSPTGIAISVSTIGACTNIVKLPNGNKNSYLQCNLPSGQGSNLTLTVTIDGLNQTMPFSFNAPKLYQVDVSPNNLVTITGDGLGVDSDSTVVMVNSVDYPPNSVSAKRVIFQAAPEVVNGFVQIKALGMLSNMLWFRVSPKIQSITKSKTEGSPVTILGSNLGLYDALLRENIYQIWQDSNTLSPDKIKSNATALIVTTLPGTGVGFNVDLSIEGFATSGAYSYLPPSITNITAFGSSIVAFGDNFGVWSEQVTPFQPSTLVNVTHHRAQFTIPPTFRKQMVSIIVNGQTSNQIELIPQPILSSTTMLPIQGGLITLFGNYLNGQSENGTSTDVVISVGQQPCVFVKSNQEGTQLICNLLTDFSQVDNATLSVSIDGVQSLNTLNYTSFPPALLSCSALYFNKSGLVTVSGDHFAGTDYQVEIAGQTCENATKMDNQTITCEFSADILSPNPSIGLNVTVWNNQSRFSADLFIYLSNHCDGICIYGNCFQGYCICNEGYGGQLCTIPVNTTLPLPTVTSTSKTSTTLFNNSAEFTTEIIALREIDGAGSIIKSIDMSNSKWSQLTVDTEGNISTVVNRASFDDSQLFVDVTTQYYSTNSNNIYLSEFVYVPAGSLKQSVTINSYQFANRSNSLQVIYRIGGPSTFQYNCQDSNASIVVGKVHTMVPSFVVDTPVGVLVGQFPSRTKVDTSVGKLTIHPTESSDPLNANRNNIIIYTITIPNFEDRAEFDPIFTTYNKPNLIISPDCTTKPTTSPTTGVISESYKLIPLNLLSTIFFLLITYLLN
ncbi:hypothetical protein PPL_10801 [Heterostelium album PN500]|uniref:IPT/TIG domain-containing protein n=1 Tax=Heterostelium pallidum (strain ATCC 26659 / Pp 5 / PN500) TaxID=670386 RepID=D3BS10_HETP5|nr:hypothetical protein PPL_10801 [Heterostelium album PN500]EFA75747.1 hypothetical protein PPL_10801 [Heterostelium album PN500]|eukprot:XP_020427881.1 hypothetical protein PPL_10801 [Heterostelium album PN500]